MNGTPPPQIIASKVVNTSKPSSSSGQSSPAQAQANPISGGDRGGGTFRAAGTSSRASPTPRNNQGQRNKHKASKRFACLADDDVIAESAAMRSSTGRKGQTNITHLMNFSLPPRPSQHGNQYYGQSRGYRKTFGLGSGYHAIDKARYVHANYRFVVDPRGDYHEHSADADVYLDWNNVMQILVSSQSQVPSCPICLGEPVAPRMAKCGHIFCLPCLIRFMQAEEDTKRLPEKKARHKKCPICEDTIYISDTKPVRMYAGQEGPPPREGGDVVLRLVKRSSGSTLALPRDGAVSSANEDVPWYNAAEVMDYARVIKGSEDYMTKQYESDVQLVQEQERIDALMFPEDTAEWTRKAVRMLEESKEKVKGIGGPAPIAHQAKPVPERAPIEFSALDNVPAMYAIQHALRAGQSIPNSAQPAEVRPSGSETSESETPSGSSPTKRTEPNTAKSLRDRRPSHTGQHAPAEYFFYQALLHYYLSPLDIRILREAFGSFASFPSTILPRVERVSTAVVDEDLRKRAKYLGHLPYGCEVNFLECDWADTVAPEVLEKFLPEIERRRRRNEEKETREEKARLYAEKEEEKRYAHLRRKRPEAESPEWAIDAYNASATAENVEATDGISTSPPWPTRQGSSFASLASISTSPSQSRTVWGTATVNSTSPQLTATAPSDANDDGWLQGWEKDLLQEDDAMVARAQELSLAESSKAAASAPGGGKKKKAKKITLMSTTARRGA
ncbi:Acetyl-CoA acetyltransferase [Venturia nashicola]|nr:Acetyl-CoA acetyltransferase [Venturia nashicola]